MEKRPAYALPLQVLRQDSTVKSPTVVAGSKPGNPTSSAKQPEYENEPKTAPIRGVPVGDWMAAVAETLVIEDAVFDEEDDAVPLTLSDDKVEVMLTVDEVVPELRAELKVEEIDDRPVLKPSVDIEDAKEVEVDDEPGSDEVVVDV